MKNFNKLFDLVCRPCPIYFPDHHEASVRLIKNKFTFVVHLATLAFHILSFFLIPAGIQVCLLRFATGLCMLGIFLLFCRARPLVAQIMNASLITLTGLVLTHYYPESANFGLTTTYGIPCAVFYMTHNVILTALGGFLQLAVMKYSLKENLIHAINYEGAEAFAENFVVRFIWTAIPLLVLYLIVVYKLEKKTCESLRATRKAEEALEQQKIFLYSFSHEMRNPMNSLLGNLDLALMGEVLPETREMLSTAKVCGMLLLNLINTVLDAGKLGIGKLEVNPVPTRVHGVFQKVWSISHDIISKKGLKCHLKISNQVPMKLLLDSHRLNQVLMNLIGNATKFTESGMITLSVNWLEEKGSVCDESFEPIPYDDEDEGVFEKEYNLYAIKRRYERNCIEAPQSLILAGTVKEFCLARVQQPAAKSKGVLKIIIRDSGCGMKEEELKKLFKKFSQVGETNVKKQMGTGLGLFISKEIVENMGGEIRAYSKPGTGSTFIICIPTTAMPMRHQSEKEISLGQQLIPKLKMRKLTSIVADDSAFNVSLVCAFYAKIGVRVLTTANNGKVIYERWLEMVKAGGFVDVVTLDIDMPGLSGKEVCKKIRQCEKERNLKRSMIVLISGNYEEKDLDGVLSGGDSMSADYFLRKPLVFEELCWALYKHESISSLSEEHSTGVATE